MSPKPTLRLAARCPECGEGPAIRVERATVEKMRDHDPDERVMTVQCQYCLRVRRKIVHYEVTAAAYHGAA